MEGAAPGPGSGDAESAAQGLEASTSASTRDRQISVGSKASESNTFISTTSSGNEKWLSPLDRLSLQPAQHAAVSNVSAMSKMEEEGVDLRSLDARRPPPLYHQPNASTTRMPFHGDESFPGSPQVSTPGLYDTQFAAGQRDSQAELLLSGQRMKPTRTVSFGPSTTFEYPGEKDLPPPGNRDCLEFLSWTPPGWHPSFGMYICFIFGVLCSVGHHLYYVSLDGRPAEKQTETLRYGTFLAYAAKASFSAAVVSAFKQRVWVSVRSRFMTISGLDAMFSATESMFAMLNLDFFRGAKGAWVLAVLAWTTPLVVILTSNTLLVEPTVVVQNTTCPAARSLNFSFEEISDWRNPQQIDGLFEIPVSIWNTTKRHDQTDDDWYDYYTGPSPNFQQTAAIGAFLEQVVARKNAAVDICGSGYNCTYTIDFTAPGYKCSELASGVGSTPKNFTQETGEVVPPFGTDLLLPRGNFSYYAYTTGGEYSPTQMRDVGISGIPKIPNSELSPHFGAFRTEPIIWIGYVVLNNPDEPLPNRNNPGWDDAFTPKMFACEHRETEYKATFNYTDGVQATNITSQKFGAPVVNTTFLPTVAANDGTSDNVTAVPEENYILPNDTARYRKTAAYHSLGYMLREFLNGTVEVEDSLINPIQNTEAIQTKLLNPRNNYFPHENLMSMVQGLYTDLILSMFSNPQFTEVVWAARPSEQSGTLFTGGIKDSSGVITGTGDPEDYMFNCTRSRVVNTYAYHKRDLWIAYGVATFFSLICVTVGAFAISDNGGVTRNTRFSSVVAATRGPALEKIAWMGPLQDRGDVPNDVKKLKIGYGIMKDNSLGVSSPKDTKMNSYFHDAGGEGLGDGLNGGLRANSAYIRRRTTFSTEMRCGFGMKGDVDQTHREGSLFHR
ncbi:hypothetical protein VMCG_07004 [Cytospora schulzeri]|uniref:Formylmethionine deformylase-like protein n=1 Tax=Cytospora schulzeri TaxID=448051 RepID=A0A423W3Y1_9PEZI|nr:hypothetical protein VMCG_07004 [Valsa malicola]